MFDHGPAGLLTEELRGVVGDLDPDLMGADDADRLLGELIGVVQLAEGAIVRLVRRALESGAWRASGDRSPRHHLARRLGTSLYATDRLLETTARLDEAPQIAEAVAAGALSSKQTQLVARAGALAPDRQEELLGAARRERLVGLRDLCDRIAAAADERTDEQRHSEARRSRYVRSRNLPDGTFVLELRHTTTVGAELTALLEPFIDAEFDRLRDEGIPPEEREPAEAVAADAVVAMARAASADSAEHGARPPASGAKAKVIVRVDRTALLRGRVEGDEVCEVTGLGPVPVTAVRELMEDAFIAALLTDGTDIRSVVHLGRQPTALQRTFLEWRDDRCAVDGCASTRRLEIDHVRPWAETRHTTVDELVRLCGFDHDRKTYDGAVLERTAEGAVLLREPEGDGQTAARERRQKARRRRREARQSRGAHVQPP